MSRSIKKGPYADACLIKKVQLLRKTNKRKNVKTWSRRSVIFPEFVGLTFDVHNGRSFVSVYVTEDMIGHKFGEFVPTRVFKQHTMNRKDIRGKK